VGQYLQALQMDPGPAHLQEQLHWQRQEALVRKRRDRLQDRFRVLLLQLREGERLESLSGVELPVLAKVPTVSPGSAAAPQSTQHIHNVAFSMLPYMEDTHHTLWASG